jgi:hypothetical protein
MVMVALIDNVNINCANVVIQPQLQLQFTLISCHKHCGYVANRYVCDKITTYTVDAAEIAIVILL